MDCYELIVIELKEYTGEPEDIDGYIFSKILSEKFESLKKHLFMVSDSRIILSLPKEYGVGMGFSLNELYDEAAKLEDIEINRVAINIDYDTRRLEDVYVCHYNATRKDN